MLHAVENSFEVQACALSHSPQRTPDLVLAAPVCTVADHERGRGDDRAGRSTAGPGRPLCGAAEDRPPGRNAAGTRMQSWSQFVPSQTKQKEKSLWPPA